MASVFTISEEELFNFEVFCDSKYEDVNCQKYGFFKIKLHQHCPGQYSSMAEFYKQFGLVAQEQLRKSVLFTNPNDKNLFGHQNIAPSASEKDYFMATSFNPAAFQNHDVSPNCCVKILEDEGQETFLQHFYGNVTCKPKVKQSNYHDDLRTVQKRAISKKMAFEKLSSDLKSTTVEGKKRYLEMAMLSEKIFESSSSECLCESCDVKYCYDVLENTKSCPIKLVDLLYSAGIEESQNNYIHLTKNFAMAHLCFKNMLTHLDSVFGGVSFPALYLGGIHSVFPLHTEDLSCWSFNFLLHGSPKFWIMIPPTYVSRLTDALQRKGFFSNHRWCRNTLNHKFYIPTTEFFKEENIPFELVIQRAGEGIVVLPNTAHTGGNLGPNLAQACNFGTKKWIPYGCVALNCPCMEGSVHADLSDLVAVHSPDLLKAYLSNNIYDVVEDQYFHQSLVVPKKGCSATTSSSTVSTPSVAQCHSYSKRNQTQANTVRSTRVKCPVCEVSWAYNNKPKIIIHLNKYHACRMNEDIVMKFIKKFSISKK